MSGSVSGKEVMPVLNGAHAANQAAKFAAKKEPLVNCPRPGFRSGYLAGAGN